MPIFPFFSDYKLAVAQLIEQSRTATDPVSRQPDLQIQRVFDPMIEHYLSKTERADEPLRLLILFELAGLIGTLPPTDTYFEEHFKTILGNLIDACRWKRTLNVVSLDEAASGSRQRQTDIQLWLTRIRERPGSDRIKRLALMLTETDQQAVAIRTLRAFLAFYNHEHSTEPTALFWLRDGRVQLRINLIRAYLLEQIALRVYLFHFINEAYFIDESLVEVKNWVTNVVRAIIRRKEIGPELVEGVNDIVSKVKIEFIHKCEQYRKVDPELFYLDAKLSTYLVGYVKQDRSISKLLSGQQEDDIEELTDEDSNEEDGLLKRTENEQFPPDPVDPWGELKERLRRGLNLLEAKYPECRQLIMRHFNNDFGQPVPFQTLALEFGEPAKTLETRFYKCIDKLKKLIDDIS